MKRPILYIAVPFSAGIALSRILNIPIAYPIILSAVFTTLALLWISRGRLNVPYLSHTALYLAVFFLGIAHCQNSDILPPDHISRFTTDDPKTVFLRGVVVDDPVVKRASYNSDGIGFTLSAVSYKGDRGWKNAAGFVRVDLYPGPERPLNYGDEVMLKGMMSRPSALKNPGLFDYSKYLATKNIYSVFTAEGRSLVKCAGLGKASRFKKAAYKIRRLIRGSFDRYLTEPYNAFFKAIVIGERTGMEEGLKEDFIKTGTVHVLAISGLHIGLVAGLILAFFSIVRMPMRLNLILTVFILILYSFVAGSNPPVVRSVIIFSILAAGYLIKRDSDMLNSLALAALLITLANPKALFDTGFQLSFISVASIIIFVPKINDYFKIGKTRESNLLIKAGTYIAKSVSVSMASWLGTWPVVAVYFNVVSPIAIAANLVVIPLLGMALGTSAFFLSSVFLSPSLALILANSLSLTTQAIFSVNHFLQGLPFSYFRIGRPSAAFIVLYYASILLAIAPRAVEFIGLRIYKRSVFLVIVLLFNISVWSDTTKSGAGILRATFLDVGQGDAIHLEFPDGKNVLIDGGPGGKDAAPDAGRSIIAPYLWNRGISYIDAILVSHFHDDHLGGLIYVLKNFNVGCVIDSGAEVKNSRIFDEYIDTIRKKGIDRIRVREKDMLETSCGAKFYVLNPKKDMDLRDSNDNSIAIKLTYKDKAVLLAGDITDEVMKRLKSYGIFLKCDIMKVPHHGGGLGDRDIVKDFFNTVAPAVSITSVGKNNVHTKTYRKTAEVITALNTISYETIAGGAVTVLIGKEDISVKATNEIRSKGYSIGQ